jgi:hypothetical protein
VKSLFQRRIFLAQAHARSAHFYGYVQVVIDKKLDVPLTAEARDGL